MNICLYPRYLSDARIKRIEWLFDYMIELHPLPLHLDDEIVTVYYSDEEDKALTKDLRYLRSKRRIIRNRGGTYRLPS